MKRTSQFQNHHVQEVESDPGRIRVAPQFGARLLTWEVGGRPIIHWPENADWSNVAHVRGGNPILFPFVARHMVDGELGKWRDSGGVVRNLPMHGFARDLPFEVIDEAEPDCLRMRLCSTDATRAMYPFDWTFDVVYRLAGPLLEVVFETANSGALPLPYYPGHHFYFAVPHLQRAQWQLALPCSQWGWQNPDGSVRFEPATASTFTLDDTSLIDRFHLTFAPPRATLKGPDYTVDLDLSSNMAPWFDVTTWTLSPDSDFFCIEPWLGLPNAIHHADGLRWIPPGETERATVVLTAWID